LTEQAYVATAEVATEKASGYLQQLCKHFGHKVPVEFDLAAGSITFPFGSCTLAASPPDRLTLRVVASTAEDIERMKEVVGGHLERFAFREALRVEWMPAASA
jgi:uncharacterized protein